MTTSVTVLRWPVLEMSDGKVKRRTTAPVAWISCSGVRSTRFTVSAFFLGRWALFSVKTGAARRASLRDYLLDLASIPPYLKGPNTHATSEPNATPHVEPSPDG